MKKIIQLTLLLATLISLYIFYDFYFKDKQELNVNDKNYSLDEIDPKVSDNSIKNLLYEVIIDGNKSYTINSKNSQIIYINGIEFLEMQIAEGKFTDNKDTFIIINSDKAIYNIENHETKFMQNVRVAYLDNIITGENLVLNVDRKEIDIFKNIKYEGLELILLADRVKIDLNTKKIDILMDGNSEKVTLKMKK